MLCWSFWIVDRLRGTSSGLCTQHKVIDHNSAPRTLFIVENTIVASSCNTLYNKPRQFQTLFLWLWLGEYTMPTSKEATRWRATGSYVPTLSSKTSLLEETRQFLLTYARLGDLKATRQALVNGGLPQRSHATRNTIVRIIQLRLTRWNPPAWVLDDLISFAQDGHQPELQAALLLHSARQDVLLYDIIQHIVVSHWFAGDHKLITSDVQRFLDDMQALHPEVARWSHSTRVRLSRHALAALRDFGLLQGKVSKRIVEPIVPPSVVQHLIHLLQAEGIQPEQLAQHPDWQLWLWDAAQAQKAIEDMELDEGWVMRQGGGKPRPYNTDGREYVEGHVI